LIVAASRGVAVALPCIQAGQQEMGGREIRMLRDYRFRAHDCFAGFTAEMKDAGNPQFWLRTRRIELQGALENGTRLVERPLIQAGVSEQHEKWKIVRRHGDGLAERIELGHKSTLEREGKK
jgi:hypothetical protein